MVFVGQLCKSREFLNKKDGKLSDFRASLEPFTLLPIGKFLRRSFKSGGRPCQEGGLGEIQSGSVVIYEKQASMLTKLYPFDCSAVGGSATWVSHEESQKFSRGNVSINFWRDR